MRPLITILFGCFLFFGFSHRSYCDNTEPHVPEEVPQTGPIATPNPQAAAATPTNSTTANSATLPITYDSGVRLYQEQHFDEAFDVFQKYFQSGHDFAALDYNWGLTAYKLQKIGLAVGLWRRAIFLDPGLHQASQALSIVEPQLPHNWSDVPTAWNKFRTSILDPLSLNEVALLSWILFCVAGFLVIRYLGKRRHSLREETPLPAFPVVGFLFAALFIVTLTLTACKIIARNEIHATVIVTTVPLRTGPSAQDNPIFDLLEGFDVSVRTVQKDWAQVALNSGQVGWIQTASLFQHTGHRLLW